MTSTGKNCDTLQMDLMRLVDGELSEDKRQIIMQHLEQCNQCQSIYNDLKSVKEETMTLKPFLQFDLPWQDYWAGLYHRLERGVGWLLFSAGAIFLSGLAIFHALSAVWADPNIALSIKIAIYALIFGSAILLISVAREKFTIRKTDKYRRIMK